MSRSRDYYLSRRHDLYGSGDEVRKRQSISWQFGSLVPCNRDFWQPLVGIRVWNLFCFRNTKIWLLYVFIIPLFANNIFYAYVRRLRSHSQYTTSWPDWDILWLLSNNIIDRQLNDETFGNGGARTAHIIKRKVVKQCTVLGMSGSFNLQLKGANDLYFTKCFKWICGFCFYILVCNVVSAFNSNILRVRNSFIRNLKGNFEKNVFFVLVNTDFT